MTMRTARRVALQATAVVAGILVWTPWARAGVVTMLVSLAGSRGWSTQPRWSRDGSELYFWDRSSVNLSVARVESDPEPRVLGVEALLDVSSLDLTRGYDVTPAGTFILSHVDSDSQSREPDSRIHVVVNFDAELERLERALP